jgi:hypothetical protein
MKNYPTCSDCNFTSTVIWAQPTEMWQCEHPSVPINYANGEQHKHYCEKERKIVNSFPDKDGYGFCGKIGRCWKKREEILIVENNTPNMD